MPARRFSQEKNGSVNRRGRPEARVRHLPRRPLAGGLLALALLLTAHGPAPGSEQDIAPQSAAKLPFRIIERSMPEASLADRTATQSALPLKAPKKSPREAAGPFRAPTVSGAATTVITSLAVVLGLFLLGVLIVKKTNSRGGCAKLPGEVVQTLGRAPLTGRQEMHLVRVGNKLLLLSVTASGAETLTEITDPEEIDRLAGICRQNHPDSITASFREILWQCGQTQGNYRATA